MGILETLTIIFVVLKLVGVLTWGWLAVFSPMLIALVIYIILIVLNLVFMARLSKDKT